MPTLLLLVVLLVARNLVQASEFSARVTASDVPRLMQATEYVRELDEAALVELVPEQSGLFFVDCPNCTGGRQENQLEWHPERPQEVICRFCDHRYPSEKFPMNQAVTVRNPRGESVRFPYWEDAAGYRHFFQARRDDLVRSYLAARTRDLARLYVATQDKAHARRAAILLDRFAQVFPGWCYHFDYPFQQKEIYDGEVPAAEFRPGYRTARWSWWAYSDIPDPLVEAYDWIRDSGIFDELSRERGVDTAARIEHDLFRNAAEQVLANPETLSNMSPTAWYSLVYLGRVIGEPRYVHVTVRQLRRLVESQFFYDGAWSEGAPDYASQTIGGLNRVLSILKGYTDPEGYRDPEDGERFDQLDLEASFPALQRAQQTLRKMRLPNGRALPVHDTWPTSRRGATDETTPFVLPALGHACLGGGAGDAQTQFHLTWSGGYGHSHADNLSLLLFAHGRELLSDLGYTHTAYRSWTLASAAHNTVVIDGQSQSLGSRRDPSDGRMRLCDFSNPAVQVVSADGARGYAGRAKTFQRTIAVIDAGDGRWFAVDLFEVEGGETHDYFLHGDADRAATVQAPLEFSALESLLPAGFDWKPTQNEGEVGRGLEPHYAYGFLSGLRTAAAPARESLPVEFRGEDGSGPGLRVTLIPESDSQLILGENPSIRLAREDDAKLSEFQRPFMLLRRQAKGKPSRFFSVIEPFAESPFLDAVESVEDGRGAVGVRVRIGELVYLVLFGRKEPVTVPAGNAAARFEGDVGVMALRGNEVASAYCLGRGGWERAEFRLPSAGPQAGALVLIEGNELMVKYEQQVLPAKGDVVRVVTEDGWVYPYTVTEATVRGDTLQLQVAEGPGLAFDSAARRLDLLAFPQRTHPGSVHIEWLPAASHSVVE